MTCPKNRFKKLTIKVDRLDRVVIRFVLSSLRRFAVSLGIVLGVLMASHTAFSYGSAETHREVTEAILGGYGGDDFQKFCDATSGAIDSMAGDFESNFPEMTKKFNPWTHRLLGHGWSLDEDVPKWVLDQLEKEYGVSPEKVIAYCRQYQENIIKKAIELTELPREQATAFASLVIDLHHLQDLEPGNSAVKYVARIEKVMADINRHIDALLTDNPKLAAVIKKKLDAVFKACIKDGLSEMEIAKRMIDALMDCRLGTAINSCQKKFMKLVYDIDRVVNANAKAAAARARAAAAKAATAKANKSATVKGFRRVLSTSAKCKTVATSTCEDVTAKTVENTAKKAGYKNMKMVRGLLQKVVTKEGGERFVLSVPVAGTAAIEGVTAGVLTFVISEGITAVGLAKGEMTEDAFWVETWKNAGAAVLEGVAVGVVVCLGFGPAGVVAIAVGVGVYIIYEIAFNILYDINKFKGITLDDYLGIMPTEIQRRPSAFDYEGACKILNYEGATPGLGYEGRAPGLDYKGDGPGLGEVPNIRKDGFGL